MENNKIDEHVNKDSQGSGDLNEEQQNVIVADSYQDNLDADRNKDDENYLDELELIY